MTYMYHVVVAETCSSVPGGGLGLWSWNCLPGKKPFSRENFPCMARSERGPLREQQWRHQHKQQEGASYLKNQRILLSI